MRLLPILLLLPSLAWACPEAPPDPDRPGDFVTLRSVAPTIRQELRYSGSDNFLGRPVAGYDNAQCWLTQPAAEALARAQKKLVSKGLSLKVFDCYRPQRAVDDFMRWAEGPRSPNANTYYPDVPQSELIPQGYIAVCSGHSRGSTVDLTIIRLGPLSDEVRAMGDRRGCAGNGLGELDMGSGWDCFGPESHTFGELVAGKARENRWMLNELMKAQGFVNFRKEWWHYSLRDEPYPDSWFDFLPN